MIALSKFKSYLDLTQYFSTEKVCEEYLAQIRWDGKLVCPYNECKHDTIYKLAGGKYKCGKCKRKYSVRVGTIFQDSKIPLRKWFASIYLITSHKKGISSIQLAKDIGVQQKTAWFLLHRVRKTFGIVSDEENKLSGTIECDETFMGGSEGNKHKHKKTKNTQGRSVATKSAVAGVIARGGELRAQVIPDTSGYHLRTFVVKNVEFGSKLMTDEWTGYKGLAQLFKHKNIDHGKGEYVNGEVHCNSMEGFWSLLKRGVNGIYHAVSVKHLQSYIDEYQFRYNTRNYSESFRFDAMLNNIGSHLTYKQLTENKKSIQPQQGNLSI